MAARFSLAEDIVVTAPVNIKLPQSVKPGAAKAETTFKTVTVYMDFKLPLQDALDDLADEVRAFNRRVVADIAAAEARLKDAPDAARADIEEEIVRLRRSIRLNDVETLKTFAHGLPDGHGIADLDGRDAEFSPDLVGRLCNVPAAYRAMSAAFWRLVNGEGAKGN